MDYWRQIIETLGGISIAAAAISWLTKSIVTHWLSKDIETYKNSLSLESTRQIEEFKAHLQQVAIENSTRFAKLHEKRIEIIAELYYLIENAQSEMRLFNLKVEMHADGNILDDEFQQSEDKAGQVIHTLLEFLQRNKLYFGAELSNILEEMASSIYDPFLNYGADELNEHNGNASSISSLSMKFRKDWAEQEIYFRKTKEIIERDFRQILGSMDSK